VIRDTDHQERINSFLKIRIEELETLEKSGIKKVSLPMDGKTFLISEALEIFKVLIKDD
jgi:hypothetical protein|tara:strand:- start:390 stop:566 length:177 start_codon:yes stop_codon:yes gene_type:complete